MTGAPRGSGSGALTPTCHVGRKGVRMSGRSTERVETIMVVLAKASDGARKINPGVGMNDGTGTLRVIGGMPVRKIDGPAILIAGLSLHGKRIRLVAIEPVTGEWNLARLIMENGTERPVGPMGDVGKLLDKWIRFARDTGTFAGIARVR